MPTLTYDVTEVEEFTPYSGPTPKRGIYDAVVRSAEFGDSQGGNAMFTVIVVLDSKKKEHKPFNGCPLWQYITIGDLSEEWQRRNMKMLVKALGLKEKGKVTTDALLKKLDGARVRVIVKNETFNEEVVARANGLLSAKAADDEASEAADEDATEEEDTEAEGEEEEAEGDEDEEEEEEEEGEDEEEEEVSVEDEIAELDRAGLKKYIKDNELEVKVTRSMSDDDVRTAILAAWPDEDEEEEAEGDEPF